MSDHHAHDKKHKKLAQLLKNRRTQRINLAEEQHQRERDLEKEREEELLATQSRASQRGAEKKRKEGEPAWSARMQEVRDKNTGRTRQATERWNRFAGTASGGGRGL